MGPVPLCTGDIVLTENSDDSFYTEWDGKAIAVLSKSYGDCMRLREICSQSKIGAVVDCKPMVDYDESTEEIIKKFKNLVKTENIESFDFVYLKMYKSFKILRAAAIAMRDLGGQGMMAELYITDQGRLTDGTDPVAAMGVLQKIGVGTIIVTGNSMEEISDAIRDMSPYAKVSLGVKMDPDWLTAETKLYNTEIYMAIDAKDTAILCEKLQIYQNIDVLQRDHDHILAPDGKNAHFIEPTIDISDEIECSNNLGEHLIEAEDKNVGALKLQISTDEDLFSLEEHQYMLTRPVCLYAYNIELLEKALRIFEGLAIYDGTMDIEPQVLKYFTERYGLICL